MDSAHQALSAQEPHRRDGLVGRLFQSMVSALEYFHVYLGDRLGLYAALRAHGPATSVELARATGLAERYLREWLEQQAVSGLLDIDDTGAEASARRYSLPGGHAEVLLGRDSLSYCAPFPRLIVGVASQLSAVERAFRDG